MAGLLVSAIFFMGIPAFFLTFTLWLQIGLGFSARHAGLTGVPFAIGSALASTASVRLAPRLGRRILTLGTLLLAVGMGGVIWTVDRYDGATHSWQLIPALAVCGIGLGSTVAPLINIILAGVRAQDAGAASGVLTTVQQVSGVSADLAPRLAAELRAAGLPAPASGQVVAATADTARRQDFSDAFQHTLLFEVAVFLLCLVLTFLLPDPRGRAAQRAPAEVPAGA